MSGMRRTGAWAWLLSLVLALAAAGCTRHEPPVRVGSKNFTEAVVLGEIARLAGERDGVAVEHQRQLGGTRILWRALQEGQIDAYAEYTGTLAEELLHAPDADPARLRAALAAQGLAMTDSLGFQNTYALGMSEARAQALGIAQLSDLAAHPSLRVGLSNEFLQRADGWPGVRAAYRLPQQARGLDHDLAYRALASGAIDVTDLYSTDAEIPHYRLRVLRDDRRYFPDYQAVFVYRQDLARRSPRFVQALQRLQGRIDAAAMQRLNAEVKLQRRSEGQAAAGWLEMPDAGAMPARAQRIAQRTVEHLQLVGASLGAALLLALPLGVLAARRPRLGQGLIALTGVLQTLPSLALFVFMIPLFGIGARPAIAALFLYSLLPIVRNTHAGLVSIPRELRQTAAVLGLPAWTRLWRIELPLARRTILAGIQTAAVINVGTATLGALIGAGGYGQPILTGIRLDDLGLILEGAVPAALLALAVQGGFELLERALTPRGLRLAR